MVSFLLMQQVKSERISIELLSLLKIVEVQLDAYESGVQFVSVWHERLPQASIACEHRQF